MGYLSEEQILDISEKSIIVKSDDIENPNELKFDCKIAEYNEFLSFANRFSELNISKTHLLFDKESNELVGYITLSNDTLRLSKREKCAHGLQEVPFLSIPALKIGKLAINKKVQSKIKGHGSFLIEMAKAFALNLNENGVACRFLTVDADIEYDENTIEFYKKNGFIINMSQVYNEQKERYKVVSMRMDIFNDIPKQNTSSSEKAV